MAGIVTEEHGSGSQRIQSTGGGSDDIDLSHSSQEVSSCQTQASSTSSWPVYGMETGKKVIIINNTDDEIKCKVWKEMFTDLGFDPPTIVNKLSCTAIEELLGREAEKMPKEISCFVCVILSYGDDGYLCGHQDFSKKPWDTMNISHQIMGHFKGDQCNQLIGKPKLYFIETPSPPDDPTSTSPETDEISTTPHKIPVEADQLLVQSCLEDYAGLTFLDALKSSVRADGKKDLLSMLTDVMGKLARAQTQTTDDEDESDDDGEPVTLPFISSSLRKDLVFPSVSK